METTFYPIRTKWNKMQENLNEKKGVAVVSSMLLAVFLLLPVYAYKGMFPFGKGSVMLTDLYSQYGPLLYRFYDVVTGHKNLFMDFDILAGTNLYADTINEVLNPFNYILFLFGRQRIYLALNILLLAYVAAMAGAATYVLNRFWKGQGAFHCLLGVGYALSGYVAYNYQIIKWMYFPVLFPFFLLAMIEMLQGKKGMRYGLLLAYQLTLSIQLGFMTLLFCLFAGGIFARYCLEKEAGKKALSRMGVWTCIALGLSSVSLVPMVAVLLESARTGQTSSYFGVMKIHGLDDLFERIFQIANPVFVGITLPLLGRIGKKQDKWSEIPKLRKFLLILLGFLWITVLVQPANLIWHMGSYFGFPVRYGYMVLFVHGMLLAAWKAEEKSAAWTEAHISADGATQDGLPKKTAERGRLWKVPVAILLTTVAIGMVFYKEEVLTQGFSSLAISMMCPKETLYVVGLMLLLVAASFLCCKKAGVLLVCVWGMLVFLMILLPPQAVIRGMNEYAYENMQYNPDTTRHNFVRVKEKNNEPLNAGLVTNIPTLSGYIPAGNGNYLFAMRDLGYRLMRVDLSSEGGTFISDAVLTHAYVLPADARVQYESDPGVEAIYQNGLEVTDILLDARQGTVRIGLEDIASTRGIQKGDILFLPLAAVKGWRVETDYLVWSDMKAIPYGPNMVRLCDGFLGILLDRDTDSVTLTYRSPGALAGLLITLLFAVLAVGYYFTEDKCKIHLGGLYTLLFTGGIVGLYIIPTIGLVLYMTGKILGIIPR